MNPTLARHSVYPLISWARRERISKHISEFDAQQWHAPEVVMERQLRRFSRVAAKGVERFDFYRELVEATGVSVSQVRSIEDLVAWPCMTKEHLNLAVRHLRTADKPIRSHTVRLSGGSTGAPCVVLADRITSGRSQAMRALHLGWYGVNIGDRQVRLWGRPLSSTRIRERVKDWLLNRVRFDSLALDDESFDQTFSRIRRFGVEYIYGYASLIVRFVEQLTEVQLRELLKQLKVVVTTSEVMSPAQVQKLEARLGVPVVDEYGCSEVDTISFRCPKGGWHTAAENVLVEVIREGNEPDGFGHILVTDLRNVLMPVIRYRVGDLAPLERPACECARGWPCIGPVIGRVQNQYIVIDEGRKHVHSQFLVYLVERLLDRGIGIARFQILQKESDLLVLRVVPAGGESIDDELLLQELSKEGASVLGTDMRWQVAIVAPEELEVMASQKYQHFVSLLN